MKDTAFDVPPPAVIVTGTVVPGAGPDGTVAVHVSWVGQLMGAGWPPNEMLISPPGL